MATGAAAPLTSEEVLQPAQAGGLKLQLHHIIIFPLSLPGLYRLDLSGLCFFEGPRAVTTPGISYLVPVR